MKKTLAVFLVVALAFLTACSAGASSGSAPAPSGSAASPAGSSAGSSGSSSTAFNGSVTFGVIAALTGTNKATGVYVKNGAELAAETINANGGILGKELKLEFADEVDNMQASANAVSKLINEDYIMAIFGSTYSQNCIAVMPEILNKKITMFAGGSSAGMQNAHNPYVWQPRLSDDKTGIVLANVAKDKLKMKHPAILYSTQASCMAQADTTRKELAKENVIVSDSDYIGFTDDEKNFTPYLTQIMNSNADGLLVVANQLPSAMICQQAQAAGLSLPCLGNGSMASQICRDNAGEAANGWYSVTDWTPDVTTPEGKAFEQAYEAKAGAPSDMPAVVAHDSVMLFKEACEAAKTTTDREAINDGLKSIKNVKGVMNTYTYYPNHCFATSMFVTLNKDGKAVLDSIATVDR